MQLRERFQNVNPAPIAERLENPDTDPWLLFRYYALTLVHNGPTKQIEAFIQASPAVFHPEKDRFVPVDSGQCSKQC
jgi:hypothetical protein